MQPIQLLSINKTSLYFVIGNIVINSIKWEYKDVPDFTCWTQETFLSYILLTHCLYKGPGLRFEPWVPSEGKIKDKLIHFKSLSYHLLPELDFI